MEFLADENVPRPIVERLRKDGLAVRSVYEESAGADDTLVLAVAQQAELILITQDRDFGELTILRRLPVTGVLLLDLARLSLKEQVQRVASFLAAESSGLAGSLAVLEPARVRRRPLPGIRP